MMREFVEMLTAAIRGPQRRPTVILLSSTVLMVSWWYFGSPRFYLDHIAGGDAGPSAAAAVYTFASCFLLLGVVPALIVKLGFRESLTDYGLGLGDRSRHATDLPDSGSPVRRGRMDFRATPSIAAYYPINPAACDSAAHSPRIRSGICCSTSAGSSTFAASCSLGCAIAWRTNALLVQVMASSLLHFGKPCEETFAAILGGILWGAIAYRTRSLLSGLGQHYLLGISLDFFLCRR